MRPENMGIRDKEKSRETLLAESVVTMFANCSDRELYLKRRSHNFTWKLRAWKGIFSLTEKVCGVIGDGPVANEVAEILNRMGLVVYTLNGNNLESEERITMDSEIKSAESVEWILENCDYIAFCGQLLNKKENYIGECELQKLRKGSVLVMLDNYAVDEGVLKDYLIGKHIVLGIINTYEDSKYGNELCKLKNVIQVRI